MLQLADGTFLQQDDYAIHHFTSGLDEVVFSLPVEDPNYPKLNEGVTTLIETTENQKYLVQKINVVQGKASVTAPIDLSDWQIDLLFKTRADHNYIVDYGFTFSGTASNALSTIMSRAAALFGWTQLGPIVSDDITISMLAPSPLEAVQQIKKTIPYVVFRFSVPDKSVKMFSLENIGDISEAICVSIERNLRSYPEIKASSKDLVTRLYPVGKNNISIRGASANPYPTRSYIENTQATGGRIIAQVWRDERYTDQNALYYAATERLRCLSNPVRTWKFNVVDLKRIGNAGGEEAPLQLATWIVYMDPYQKTANPAMIIADVVYPYYPEKNQITVSTEIGFSQQNAGNNSAQRTIRGIIDWLDNANSDFWSKLDARST